MVNFGIANCGQGAAWRDSRTADRAQTRQKGTETNTEKELTQAEKARKGQALYARQRRKDPAVKAREKERKILYWARYYDEHLAAGGAEHE